MDIKSYEDGVHCWVDLATPDSDAAAAFYGSLFGWDVPPGEAEFGGYRRATLRGRDVAGITPQMQPGPSVWSSYVSVSDADATTARITAHGGTVIAGPMDVGDLGRMVVLQDPAGAFSGLWQPKEFPGAGIVNEPASFSWNELVTSDVPGSIDFYGHVFGWESVTHGDGPMAYTEFQVAGRSIAGMMNRPEGLPAEVPNFWTVYFSVADTDATLVRIGELGGGTMMGPMDIPQGRFAVVHDAGGAVFNIIALAAS